MSDSGVDLVPGVDHETKPIEELELIVSEMGPNEVKVLLILAKRIAFGQRNYGLLDPHDGRDWRKERAEEIQDLLVYSAISELAEAAK